MACRSGDYSSEEPQRPRCQCPACRWYDALQWAGIHQENTDRSGVTVTLGLTQLVIEVLELKDQVTALKDQVTALKDEVWELRQEVRRLQGRHQ